MQLEMATENSVFLFLNHCVYKTLVDCGKKSFSYSVHQGIVCPNIVMDVFYLFTEDNIITKLLGIERH